MNESRPLRIAIVAGESSGDTIAAGLLEALRERVPHAQFEGVAGPRMQQAGCRSLFPMERLAVRGFVPDDRKLRQAFGVSEATPPRSL